MGRKLALGSLIAALFIVAVPAHATFPGTNGRIAFVSDADGDFDVYTMSPDGSDTQPVTQTSGYERNPTWSPEGHRIAYDLDGYVHVIAADRSWVDRITTCYYDSAPAWSPDGDKITFHRQHGKVAYVMTSDATGGNEETMVTRFGGTAQDWAPDGSEIVYDAEFYSDESGSYSSLWLVDTVGGEPRRFTAKENEDSDPSWHPDSQRIAFASKRDGNLEIYVMNSDGSGVTRLTNDVASDFDPVWSPDGTKIAFVSNRGDDHEIYAMDADGTDVVQLTNNNSQEADPAWQATPTGEAPLPPEGPEQQCVRHVDRSISLRLKGHLTATGGYEERASSSRCSFDLLIERRSGGEWRKVPSSYSTSDHRYEARISDREGRYRARLKRSVAGFYADRHRDVCSAAVSEVEVHRH